MEETVRTENLGTMPIKSFENGPRKRQEDEDFAEYQGRRKLENMVYRQRMKRGINNWVGKVKGQYIDPEKQQNKTYRKIRKLVRRGMVRAEKQALGRRLTVAEMAAF